MMYDISRDILALMVKLLYKVKIFDRKNIPRGPFIVASNHLSYLDPPLVGLIFRKHKLNFMAKKELFEKPLIGRWFHMVKCIPLDRGKNSVTSMREAIKRLKDGKNLAIFPEGTRSEDGGIQEAKRGVGFIIAKAAVPVIPVYIQGTNVGLPKKGKMKLWAKVTARVGEPISPEEVMANNPDKKDYSQISTYVMKKIAELGK
jgi:1-acyl-sn-glycerol-3-phosphate acyltransferase